MNILKGKGDPGAPDISPLTKEKTTGAAKSSEPSTSKSGSPQPAKNGEVVDKAVAVNESNSSDNGNQLGLILGVAAAVAVLGGSPTPWSAGVRPFDHTFRMYRSAAHAGLTEPTERDREPWQTRRSQMPPS